MIGFLGYIYIYIYTHVYTYIYTRINCSFRNAFARQAGPLCPIVKCYVFESLPSKKSSVVCVQSARARPRCLFAWGPADERGRSARG